MRTSNGRGQLHLRSSTWVAGLRNWAGIILALKSIRSPLRGAEEAGADREQSHENTWMLTWQSEARLAKDSNKNG